MKFLAGRVYIGLAGLIVFCAIGMISFNELMKSSVLMATSLIGLGGLCLVGRRKWRVLSILSVAIYTVFFLDAAVKGFLRDYFGLRPNHYMVLHAVLGTDKMEAREFFLHNWQALSQAAAIFLAMLCAATLLERRCRRGERKNVHAPTGMKTHGAVAFSLIAFIALHFNPTMAKENPALFWPLRYNGYQEQMLAMKGMRADIAKNMARRDEWQVHYHGAPERTVVLVIGESINRSNMSIYGYPRKTTPMLDALRDDLVVFKDVVSSDSITAPSLMKMLTPADVENPDLWRKQPDVLLLAKQAGYKTFWLSNQYIGDGWISLMANQADHRTFINNGGGRGENNFDGNLLPHFKKALADDAQKKFIVVHLLGAHPTYDMRYPSAFAKFDEVSDPVSSGMKKAGRSFWTRLLRDEYDNAILYNDFVVGNLIGSLDANSGEGGAKLIYASDHGQEVGHNRDHAGHSASHNSGYEIPMLVWANNRFALNAKEKVAVEGRPYQADALNHTLLGLLRIKSKYYNPEDDIFHSEFQDELRLVNDREYRNPE